LVSKIKNKIKMPQSFYGSVDVTTLIEKLKEKHSGFYKGKNGKVYANITVWENDQPDEYGNILAVKVNASKEKKDVEKGFYIANCKKSQNDAKPVSDKDVSGLNVDVSDIQPLGQTNAPTDDSGLPF
jgi:hypothetical protein